MIGFVEVIASPVGLDVLPASIGLKVRHTGNIVPGRALLTRPPGDNSGGGWGEGLTPDAAVSGFRRFWDVLEGNPLWQIHELWNEPQVASNLQHWHDLGGYRLEEFAIETLGRIESEFGAPAIAKCGLGGLFIPDPRLDETIAIYDRVQAQFPTVQRCAHAYWQGTRDVGETLTRIQNAVWDALRQLAFRPGWVTEFNDSTIEADIDRVANCRLAVAHMASRTNDYGLPLIRGAALFANDRWRDTNGVEFGFEIADQVLIFQGIGSDFSPSYEEPKPEPPPDVPIPVPEPPKEKPVSEFNPNPLGVAVYIRPDGRPGAMFDAAKAAEAVILNDESPYPTNPALRWHDTSKGDLLYDPAIGPFWRRPFSEAA